MTRAVFLDFETNNPAVDLEDVGTWTYAEHPSTSVTCLAYAVDDGPVGLWWPGEDTPADLQSALAAGCRVVAHNALFDRTVYLRHLEPLGWPAIPLTRWSCTAFRARLARLPASLDRCAEALGLEVRKDLAGRKLMLAIARRDLSTQPMTEGERERYAAYARQDIVVLREIDHRLPEIPDPWRSMFEMDAELNARGMPLDLDAVRKLIVVRDAENARVAQEFIQLAGDGLTSPKQVERLRMRLADLGVGLSDLRHDTLEDWIKVNPKRDDTAARLIRNRLENSHSSDAKLDRMIAVASSTGRTRDAFTLHGAHTGRWSGRGVQLQNLKRIEVNNPEILLQQLIDRADGIIADTIDPMTAPGWPLSIKESIANVLRGLFKAPRGWVFVSADLGQIESRVLCWLAGQENKLAAYRRGDDVYRLEAKDLGSDSRDLGKLFVLSAGFGASGRVMLQKAPGFGVMLTESEAYELTDKWRANNPQIVDFWYDLLRTLMFVVEMPVDQEPVAFRGFSIWRDTEMLFVQLPSGRCLKYRDPTLTLSEFGKPALNVWLPKGKKLLDTTLWHGAATENVVSGIAFDIMSGSMLRLHQAGIFIVATIHDEIVALAPIEDADAIRDHMIAVMKTPPEWATGLPLAAEAFINARFLKPPKQPAHAPLPPSAADRWMICPGSIAASQAVPIEPESPYATEGTEAHRIFAACLERDLDPEEFTTDPMILPPLRHALMVARDVIGGCQFKVEIRLDPLPGIGGLWGTCDLIIFDDHDRVVAIIDLKFGAGITVEPDCLQLQIYALLSAQQYGCPPTGIDLHIIQPRRQHLNGPHRVHRLDCAEMTDLVAKLQAAVEATEDPAAPRVPGEHCRFCPARQDCAEARSAASARPLINPFIGGFR